MHDLELINLTIDYLHGLGFKTIDVNPKIHGAQPDMVVFSDQSKVDPIIIVELKRQLPPQLELLHPSVQRAFQHAAFMGSTSAYLLISDGNHHHWFKLKDEGGSLDYATPPEQMRSFASRDDGGRQDQILQTIVNSILASLNEKGMRIDMRSARDILRIIVAWAVCEDTSHADLCRTLHDPRAAISSLLADYLPPASIGDDGWILPPDVVRYAFNGLHQIPREHVRPHTIARLFWTQIAPLLIEADQASCSPQILAQFMVDLVGPKDGERLIDPSCGTGQFLVESHLTLSASRERMFRGQLKSHGGPSVMLGWERDCIVADVARLNVLLAGLGADTVENKDAFRQSESIAEQASFDVVISDPPVGKLSANSIAIWPSLTGIAKTIEAAFVERSVSLLRVGGRAALLLPESFFFSRDRARFREWLLGSVQLQAIISLPPGAWTTARSHTQASILVFKKGRSSSDYSVFVADLRSQANGSGGLEVLTSRLLAVKHAFARFLRTPSESLTKENDFSAQIVPSKFFTADRIDIAGVSLESWRRSPASVPTNYAVAKLCDVAEIILGKHVRRKIECDENAAANYIQAGNVRRFNIEIADAPKLSSSDVATVEAARLRGGDVLITSTGQYLGRCAIVNENILPAVASNAVTILRISDRSRLDPRFLVAFLNSPAGIVQFEQRGIKGVAQPYLRRGDIEGMLIPLPPLDVQRAAVEEIWGLLARADAMVIEAEAMKSRAHTLLLDVLSKEHIQ